MGRGTLGWEPHKLSRICAVPRWKESHQALTVLSPAHSQRLVNVKSRLKHAPRYPSLDRELTEYQQRQLFEYFVVVSLHKKQAGAAYVPELTQQFPLKVQGGPPSCHLVGTHGFREVRESEERSVSTVLDHESSVGYSKQKRLLLENLGGPRR